MPRRPKKPLAVPASDVSMVGADGVDDILPTDKHAHKQDALDNVRKIFKLAIPGFEAAKNHTTSRSTRVPGYYDKHLDKLLRPTKVAYCPSLNMQIGEIADRCLQEYVKQFGPPPKCRSTNFNHVREVLYECGAPAVEVEAGIVHHYAKVIPNIILPIVSELAFETSSWQTRYLRWTEQRNDKAITDAVLRLDPNYPPPGSSHHYCPHASLDRGDNGLLSGEASVRDETPMVNCPVCDHPSRNDLKHVAHHFPDVTLYEFKNLLAGSYKHMIALLEITCDDNVPWEECDSQTCKHDTIDFRVTGSKTGFDAAEPIVQLEVADWTKPPVQLKNTHRTSARHVFQQIWSEMVKSDATFLVLSCGNIDMIVVRSRAERTLYLGAPIFTTEPGYIGMLVGLSIASIRDAIDRAAQLRACENAHNLPSSWTGYTDDDHVKNENDELDLGSLDFGQMIRECRKLSLVPKRGSGVQKRPGNLYKRYPKQGSYDLNIRIEPIANDKSIFIGLVKWKNRVLKDYVIVKTAQGKDDVQELARESCIFRSLMGDPQGCKIPFMYGFFVDLSNTDEPYAIILEQYVGIRLSDEPSQSQQNSLEKTLEYARERGYEYCDVKRRSARSVVVKTDKDNDNGEAEVYLVGLSKLRPLLDAPGSRGGGDTGLLSTLVREIKRQKKEGACIYLGPIPSTTRPPKKVFERVTAWVRELEGQATLPETAHCIGWVDSLPDWLEIGILPANAVDFEELWGRRPEVLRRIVCMRMGAWS